MQFITAPSKTQRFNGRTFAEYSLPLLQAKTATLIDRLKSMDRNEISGLMNTSERLTESTHQMIDNFTLPFSLDNSKQALFTFQGDAYSAIDAEHYSKKQLLYAQKHLFILSGLYGILRPLDLMQPYRLEMACSLAAGGADNLYQFWQEQVTHIINQTLSESGERVLINLASKEYSKVIDNKKLQGEMITITFKQLYKGQFRTIPIHAKRARGLMINFAVSKQIEDSAALKEFDSGGYSFNAEKSTAREWLFTKK